MTTFVNQSKHSSTFANGSSASRISYDDSRYAYDEATISYDGSSFSEGAKHPSTFTNRPKS